MILKLPFNFAKRFIIEKEVEVTFKFATLEVATLDVLGCDLWGVTDYPAERVNVAILYAAYITACKDKYKKPKYNEVDAAFWVQHMSKESELAFYKSITELLGKYKKQEGKEETEEKKK